MRISEKRYHKIYEDMSKKRRFGDAEWRRRGFTIEREFCGCVVITREVIGFGFTTITEYCRECTVREQSVPLTIKLDG